MEATLPLLPGMGADHSAPPAQAPGELPMPVDLEAADVVAASLNCGDGEQAGAAAAADDASTPGKKRAAAKPKAAPAGPAKQVDEGHNQQLLRRICEVFENEPASCDLVLVAGVGSAQEGVEVPVHSVVARAMSGLVERALGEKPASAAGPARLALPTEVRGTVLRELVQYMYRGTLAIDNACAGDMLSAATALEIKGAMGLCGRFLKTSFTPSNVLQRYMIAVNHNIEDLMASALAWVDTHFASVTASKEWNQLDRRHVAAILGRDSLQPPSEDAVLGAIQSWTNVDREGRLQDYLKMVQDSSVLRACFLSAGELTKLEGDEAIKQCQPAADIFHAEMVRRLQAMDADGKAPELPCRPRSGEALKKAKEAWEGKSVSKKFGGKVFKGKVANADIEEGTGKVLLRVAYDDGDKEDVYEDEANEMVALAAEKGKAKASAGTPGSAKKRKTPTPKASKGGSTPKSASSTPAKAEQGNGNKKTTKRLRIRGTAA